MIDFNQLPDDTFSPTDPGALPTLDTLNLPKTEKVRLEMAEFGKENLYFLSKIILGYKDLNPRVHLPMCNYYDATRDIYNRRMSLMPRTHFKTTIWTLCESILDVCNDPNIRILMIADTGRNAELFMLEIQQHFQFNSVFQWIYPDLIPENFTKARWNRNEMQVPRTIIAREPTIDAIGAMGGSESRHYNKIRADDLITEKCIRSETEMDKVCLWANGLESLLVSQKEGQIDFVGSRKKKGDLYEVQLKSYSEGSVVQNLGPHVELHGELVVFSRHVLENNKPIFPERVSARFLNRLRRVDPQRYHAQYANSPKGDGINTFDMDMVGEYSWTEDKHNSEIISCVRNGKELFRSPVSELDRILLFDPAVAEKKSNCKQAILVVAKGSHPFRIILESYVGHYAPDEAVDILFAMQKKWNPSIQSIEKRGFQGWVKYWLHERAIRDDIPFLPIVEWPPQGSPVAQWAKTEHIRALQPMIRAGYLWLHPSMNELKDDLEFYPNVRWDDGLDALAQGLTYWPYAVDENDLQVAKKKEMDYLQSISPFGDVLEVVEKEWNEAEWLKQFDATGYGIRA